MKDRLWLALVVFLFLALVGGIVTLAARSKNNGPVEISISRGQPERRWADVCITGAVASPGFYSLRETDTLSSLLRDARPLPEADAANITISVPRLGETRASQKIDINRADAWLLEALPGIGPSLAQAIVAYRNEHQRFGRVEDLLKVNGIAPATLDKVKKFVTVAD